MRLILSFFILAISLQSSVCQNMTPEMLWQLGRLSPLGLSTDKSAVIYKVTHYDIESNSSSKAFYRTNISDGQTKEIEKSKLDLANPDLSPDGTYEIFTREVKLKNVTGEDYHPDLPLSNVYIYDALNYRHWDQWEDGFFSHIFIRNLETGEETDLMKDQPYDCPQMPFGGPEDYTWNHDGSKVFYVTKKSYGTDYTVSTNTDLFSYDIKTGQTTNLTKGNEGYDTYPVVSPTGQLAYLQMDEPGYESDKNDIILLEGGKKRNLTKDWDGTVYSFIWSQDEKDIYFYAPVGGTRQLFKVNVGTSKIDQITDGVFDVSGIVGEVGNTMIVKRNDMNHAPEIYTVDLTNGEMTQLTHVNDDKYDAINLSRIEKRMVTTTDNKQMVTWVIYPPDFDPNKKYPTLLYCQGGPQGALSQFYSYRWNFQLMAAQGYIVVAPNRRGMPGYGVEWNEQISGDYGGQNMQDYLAAIDDVARESYVDTEKLGCVGASYGGYSVFYLAGHHQGRFKSFIAHDGIFNTRSMYGTTEELFFVNKDLNGPYWNDINNKSYNEFNPINHVHKWTAPILIIQGGRDYRVPIGQALEAFQAAQLLGIKSKLLYFPEENHWILSVQNGLVWQKEFFSWLKETLN